VASSAEHAVGLLAVQSSMLEIGKKYFVRLIGKRLAWANGIPGSKEELAIVGQSQTDRQLALLTNQ
jgi:hypothetical protein